MINYLGYLSTISVFGAKLISLYLFLIKNSGKLMNNGEIFLWISTICVSVIMCV